MVEVTQEDVDALLELWDRVAPDPVDELEDSLAVELGLEDTLRNLRQENGLL